MSTADHRSPAVVTPPVRWGVWCLSGGGASEIDRPLTVGRQRDCDIVVEDPTASSEHVRLAPADGGVAIIDLGSRNGTFIDGRRLGARCVVRGGIVRCGDSVLAIHPLAETLTASSDPELVGGAALTSARRIAGLVAPTDLPVLVTGETGTGKDVMARWIHRASRRDGSLQAVNCAALPASLIEAELFGHARGSFTGAGRASPGLIATSAGGTLFLDEVGELPLEVQAKLLRVLDDHVVRPVGATHGEAVDFRLVCATNVELPAAVASGRFRADLYARIAAVEITMPALRTHPEDLPLLIAYLAQRSTVGARRLSPDALEAMARHEWPMNVRELDHVLRRAFALCDDTVELHHLPEALRLAFRHEPPPGPEAPRAAASKNALTPERVAHALAQHAGNVRQTALELGIPRSRLYRLMSQWRLDPSLHRSGTTIAKHDSEE